MGEPLTIWCNAALPDCVYDYIRQAVGAHRLVVSSKLADNLTATGPDPALLSADIVLGQPDPQMLLKADRLRLIQLTSAGYTRYDRQDLREALSSRRVVLCNSSSVYADPCAQHVLGMMLALSRQLPESTKTQLTDHEWPSDVVRANQSLLTDQSVLIFGYGAIARRLVELLKPFGMKIRGIRRTIRGDEAVPMVSPAETDAALAQADHVINILPDSPSSAGYFDQNRFGRMKPSAIFYNIGRGNTVDQSALRSALESRHLAAAYLDVTSPEPLPPTDPLWTTPNCHITPHSAGGHRMEFHRLADHFVQNLRRFERREALLDRII